MEKQKNNATWLQVFLKWCNVYGIKPKAIEVHHNSCTIMTFSSVEQRTLRRLEAMVNHPATTYRLQGLARPGIVLKRAPGVITAIYRPQ